MGDARRLMRLVDLGEAAVRLARAAAAAAGAEATAAGGCGGRGGGGEAAAGGRAGWEEDPMQAAYGAASAWAARCVGRNPDAPSGPRTGTIVDPNRRI